MKPRTRGGRGRSRRALLAAGLILIGFVLTTARLFVLPSRDEPTRADAIVVLGGWGDRLGRGIALAKQGYAPVLIVSQPYQGCPDYLTELEVVCFRPDPFTTQGEAEYAANQAQRRGWHHLIVVASTDQLSRARIRFDRCTDVRVDFVSVATPPGKWAIALAYQWGALVKSLTLQRTC